MINCDIDGKSGECDVVDTLTNSVLCPPHPLDCQQHCYNPHLYKKEKGH